MNEEISIIQHPAYTRVNVLREDYMGICKDAKHQHCCALLLNLMEHWTNYKWTKYWEARSTQKSGFPTVWIFLTQPEIKADLMEMYGETVIANSLTWLVEQGFIRRRFNPKKRNDRTIQYLLMTNRIQKAVNKWALSESAPTKVQNFAKAHVVVSRGDVVKIRHACRKNTTTLPQESFQFGIKDSASPKNGSAGQSGRNSKSAAPKPKIVDNPPAPGIGSHQEYCEAICKEFGWDWETVTITERGKVAKASKALRTCPVPVLISEIPLLVKECKAKGWTNFSPLALTSVVSDMRKNKPKPTENGASTLVDRQRLEAMQREESRRRNELLRQKSASAGKQTA